MKKLFTVFIAMVLLLQSVAFGVVWAVEDGGEKAVKLGTPKDHPFSGGGTESDPFIVSEKEHLDFITQEINACNEYYMYSYYRLANDIDLLGAVMTPIGTSSAPLVGTFDGNGYKIHNFKIQGTYTNSGFFGASLGIVQNLILENVEIQGTVYNCGAVVGINGGIVSNCSASATINVSNQNAEMCVGGVVGKNLANGRVYFCRSLDSVKEKLLSKIDEITVSSTSIYKNTPVNCGGLVGKNSGVVSTSYSNMDINATAPKMYDNYAGGLVGYNDCEIVECYAYGKVKMSGTHEARVGGLVGKNSDAGTVQNCFAAGDVYVTTVDMMSSCLASGLIAEDSKFGMLNCYRLRGQDVFIDQNDPYNMGGTIVKNGTLADHVDFCSEKFRTTELKWSKDNWEDNVVSYPELLPRDKALKRYTLQRVYGTTSTIFDFSTMKVIDSAFSSYNSETKTLIIEIPEDNEEGISPTAYHRVEIENCTLRSFANLALVRSGRGAKIAAVHCDGMDALANEVIFSENSVDEYELRVYPNEGYTPARYELLNQNNKVLATSEDGVFKFVPCNFDTSDLLYVRLVDSNGHAYPKIRTNICFAEDISVDDIMGKIDFGLGITSFVVPEDVPIVGGKKINLVDKVLKFGIVRQNDRIYAALGYNLDENDRDKNISKPAYDEFKKGIQNLKKGLSNLGNLNTGGTGFDENWGIDVVGYLEIPLDSRGYPHLNGFEAHVLLVIKGEYEQQWQYQLGVVPIVLKFSVGAKGSVHVTAKCTKDNFIRMTGEFEIDAPSIRGSAGVGFVKALDLSIYGSVTNSLVVSMDPFRVVSKLKGEIGLSGTAFTLSSDLPFIKGEVLLYDSKNWENSDGSIGDGVGGDGAGGGGGGGGRPFSLREAQDIVHDEGSYSLNRIQGNNGEFFADGQYASDKPYAFNTSFFNGNGFKTVYLEDGSAVSVWIEDIADRSDYNHTALVWSRLDPVTGTWSEPLIVEDDGTADFYPEILTDGEKVYVAWSDTDRVFDGQPTFEETAASQEISVALLVGGSEQSLDVTTVTSDEYFDYYAKMLLKDGEVYLGWIKNLGNDVLTSSGTNMICVTKLSDLSAVNTLVTIETPIIDWEFGVMNDGAYAAYVTDADSDLLTVEDRQLCGVDLGGNSVALGNGVYGDMLFAEVNGKNMLIVVRDGNVLGFSDINADSPYTVLENVDPYGLAFVENGEKDGLIFISAGDDGSSGGNAYVSFCEGEVWTSPAVLVSATGSVKGIFAKSVDGGFEVTYSDNVGYVTEDAIKHYTDMCHRTVYIKPSVALDDIYCEPEVGRAGYVNLSATVTNTGLAPVSRVRVRVLDASGRSLKSEIIAVPLDCGEQNKINVTFRLSSLNSIKEYSISCVPVDETGITDVGEKYYFTVGESDLTVSVDRVSAGNNSGAVLTVTNNGVLADYPTVYLHGESEEGALLHKASLGKIEAGETVKFVMSPEFIRSLNADSANLYVNAVGERNEIMTGDNDVCFVVEVKDIQVECDMNSDGYINVLDLIALKNYAASANNEYVKECDLNDDGFIDSYDCDILMEYIAG